MTSSSTLTTIKWIYFSALTLVSALAMMASRTARWWMELQQRTEEYWRYVMLYVLMSGARGPAVELNPQGRFDQSFCTCHEFWVSFDSMTSQETAVVPQPESSFTEKLATVQSDWQDRLSHLAFSERVRVKVKGVNSGRRGCQTRFSLGICWKWKPNKLHSPSSKQWCFIGGVSVRCFFLNANFKILEGGTGWYGRVCGMHATKHAFGSIGVCLLKTLFHEISQIVHHSKISHWQVLQLCFLRGRRRSTHRCPGWKFLHSGVKNVLQWL